MDFKVLHGKDRMKIVGTSLKGYVYVDYDELVRAFGEPTEADGYKSDAEWVLEFEDGQVATIHNYKDGINYLGVRGKPVEQITEWHIGGFTNEVVEKVAEILGCKFEKFS